MKRVLKNKNQNLPVMVMVRIFQSLVSVVVSRLCPLIDYCIFSFSFLLFFSLHLTNIYFILGEKEGGDDTTSKDSEATKPDEGPSNL